MSVEDLEAKYPYLRGHIFICVEGSRSVSCALCGAFRSEHPVDKQGTVEPLPVSEVRSILADIDKESRGLK